MRIVNLTWEEALPIRHQVLWPDAAPAFCKVDGDEAATHYGVMQQGELVCVASVFDDGDACRLRKFATLPSCQGKGIGSALLQHMLADVAQQSYRMIWLDARESAVSFYRRFGFRPEGALFYKSGEPYYRMQRAL